jgi:serine/threonine protein kinase/Tol biopolymer transport system component
MTILELSPTRRAFRDAKADRTALYGRAFARIIRSSTVMSLPPGSRVGIYQVVEMIGVGGMGEVYRATDSRLDRPVAIKTLPEEFSADPERLARFEREAKVLAQLNHPHIASIYGIEPGPPVALAMEMADGETLAHRLQSGTLETSDALLIAKQIAEGLEHAHAKGIIHRDLKPANIKIGPAGGDPHVKILDFGLAKAMSTEASASAISAVSSPTITSPANLTRAGIVLGTAAYMSPEQARGRFVDQRADIWAFGCVLFELLSGRRPFEGDEVADVLARVIQSEPEWPALPSSTPAHVRTLLKRCLQKDPHRRLHSIADVRIELEEGESGANAPAPVPSPTRSWLPALGGIAVGAAITAGGLALMQAPEPTAPTADVIRITVTPPEGWTFVRNPNNNRLNFALSPDGEKLVAVLAGRDATRKLFVRRLNDTAFRELPGTETAQFVFWAPDSERIGYGSRTGLRVVDLNGTGSQALTTQPTFGTSAWGNDLIVSQTVQGSPLMLWRPNSNEATPLGTLPEAVQVRVGPRWLPDGKRVLFLDVLGNGTWHLRASDLSGNTVDVRQVESSGAGSTGLDVQSGHLLLCVTEPSGRTVLTAQPFDADALRLHGTPVVLATDINCAFSSSTNGRLAMGENRVSGARLVWLNDQGAEGAALGSAVAGVTNFDLSHDEKFVVAQHPESLVLHDIARGASSPLAIRGTDPIFSPDDREFAFSLPAGEDAGIYAVPIFGGERRLLFSAKTPTYVEDWSMDGRYLSAVSQGQGMVIPLRAGDLPIQLQAIGTNVTMDELQFSPDSRWLTYSENRPGTSEVFMTTTPPGGQRWQLSVGGGSNPRWSADGRSVHYLSMSGALMRVDLAFKPGADPQISTPLKIFDAGIQSLPTLDQFSVTRSGQYLVKREMPTADTSRETVQIIVNWPSLMRTSQTAPH